MTERYLEEKFVCILFSLHEQFCKFLLQDVLFVSFDCTAMDSCCICTSHASQSNCKDYHEDGCWIHFEIFELKITLVLSVAVMFKAKMGLL